MPTTRRSSTMHGGGAAAAADTSDGKLMEVAPPNAARVPRTTRSRKSIASTPKQTPMQTMSNPDAMEVDETPVMPPPVLPMSVSKTPLVSAPRRAKARQSLLPPSTPESTPSRDLRQPDTALQDVVKREDPAQSDMYNFEALKEALPDTTDMDSEITKEKETLLVKDEHEILEPPRVLQASTYTYNPPKSLPEAEVLKRRTIISQLVLINFKSYAGKQVIGPFHRSFTSVVGPNGSGKSNVIDSLLFVFGFRASKMRQGKISALIHNSANHPNLDSCTVEVHFAEIEDNGSSGFEVVPESTLIVGRRAFKNNNSVYTINQRNSTFTEVTSLLKDKGIDLDHKRFLILQGEVESIAQMKPKAQNEHDDGLLEYLEDIIGTSKYKQPIEEAVIHIDGLIESCLEKSNRLAIVAKEKASLEDKRNGALHVIERERTLAEKQNALYQLNIANTTNIFNMTLEKVAEIKSLLNDEGSSHTESNSQLKGLEKVVSECTKVLKSLSLKLEGTKKELAKAEKESVQLDEKKKHMITKQKKAQKTLQSSKHGLSESKSWLETHADEVEKHTGTLKEKEAQIKVEDTELESIRESLKSKTQVFTDQIEIKQRQLEPWTARWNEKTSEVKIKESELAIIQEMYDAATRSLSDAQDRIKALEADKADKVC